MRCNKCSYSMPYVASDDRNCPSCRDGTLQVTAEDWLGEPSMGLVKEVRPGQITLGNIIEEALQKQENQIVIAQGGCGIGKTFSYLIPSMLTHRRVVISTAKKSLQGQLDAKDLPYIHGALGRPRTFVSVKGRGNYLCRLYLRKKKDLFSKDPRLLQRLERFLHEHPSGDLDAFPGGVRYPVTACTATECIGRSCTHATDCGYRKIKARAKVDDAVVVNHALLGFDLKFGPRVLLGEYDILIIDEAHAAEDYFRNAFTSEISTAWMKRTLGELHKQNITLTSISDTDAKRDWKQMFDNVPRQEILPVGFFGDLTPVHETLGALLASIDQHAMDFWPAVGSTLSTLAASDQADALLGGVDPSERDEVLICAKLAEKIADMQATLRSSEDQDDNVIRVREDLQDGFKVIMKPIDIGRMVGPKLQQLPKLILTSATLDAGLIERDLGFKAHSVVNEPSPFNYKANGLVYIPKSVPNPTLCRDDDAKEEWVEAVGRECVQLIRASNGDALVLFTSIREMEGVLGWIEDNFEMDQQIFAQESGRRPDEVFQEFMDTDNSVLFGSKSFFEGIDVQGDKLKLVVLTKLPFPIWGDPIIQAKKQQLGDKHFAQCYLPKMFVDLMQAAGRLIRTQHDRGVFAILDVRMWVGSNKRIDPEKIKISAGRWPGYGNKAFQQLPFSNVTPNFAMAKKFLEHIRGK
jgi:ATP-dependent DNA helicase DinG